MLKFINSLPPYFRNMIYKTLRKVGYICLIAVMVIPCYLGTLLFIGSK